MHRIRVVLTILIALSCRFAIAADVDLMGIGKLEPKGRIQDQRANQMVSSILNLGDDAIPFLIDRLVSETPYRQSPFDHWPEVLEGDVALALLSDLFLDPTLRKSSLPDFCWDNILGRDDPELPAWEVARNYFQKNSRVELQRKWRDVYALKKELIVWDDEGRFFKVSGFSLQDCP